MHIYLVFLTEDKLIQQETQSKSQYTVEYSDTRTNIKSCISEILRSRALVNSVSHRRNREYYTQTIQWQCVCLRNKQWPKKPLRPHVGVQGGKACLPTDDTHQYEYLGRVSKLVPNLSRGRKFFFNPKRTSILASTLVINFVFSDPRKITENDGRDTQYVRNPTRNDLPCM